MSLAHPFLAGSTLPCSILAASLTLAACDSGGSTPDSGLRPDAQTQDGAGPDAQSLDGAQPDAVANDGAAADAVGLDGAAVDARPRPDTGPRPDGAVALTRTYTVATLAVPAPSGGRAAGFNLDGRVDSGDMDGSCVGSTADFISVTDASEVGVDNGLGPQVTTFGTLLAADCPGATAATCLSAIAQATIDDGSFSLVLEVSDIDSFDDDAFVVVTPTINGVTAAAIDAEIVGGRLSLSIAELLIPLAVELRIRDTRLSATISDTALSGGAIGGALRLDELVEAIEAAMPGTGTIARSLLRGAADLEPSSVPTTCDAISTGMLFTATAGAVTTTAL
ncbi:MAG: hypothetical protein SFX73_17260 [Kofleriaceae bacterium]|nr:hypothetical protein [Kofleriaceae bacterium]